MLAHFFNACFFFLVQVRNAWLHLFRIVTLMIKRGYRDLPEEPQQDEQEQENAEECQNGDCEQKEQQENGHKEEEAPKQNGHEL